MEQVVGMLEQVDQVVVEVDLQEVTHKLLEQVILLQLLLPKVLQVGVVLLPLIHL